MSFSKIALGSLAVATLATGSDAFAPASPLALRSRSDARTTSLGLCMSSFSSSPASKTAATTSGEVVGKAAPASRRDFGKLIAGIVIAGGLPSASFAAKKEKKSADGTIVCKTVANSGAEMGGTKCEGITEIEFTPAFRTSGTATKLTGDKNKLSTYFSQINAGLLTLVDLDQRWDQYIASGDGDVVRRRLGTVGSKSPLHNIRKCMEGAVKSVSNDPNVDAEKFDELDELYNSAVQGIAEVDYFLYSTAFVGTKETADQLRADGKVALKKVLGIYQKLVAILEPLNA